MCPCGTFILFYSLSVQDRHAHLLGPQSTGTLPSTQASQDMSTWPKFPAGQGGPLTGLTCFQGQTSTAITTVTAATEEQVTWKGTQQRGGWTRSAVTRRSFIQRSPGELHPLS